MRAEAPYAPVHATARRCGAAADGSGGQQMALCLCELPRASSRARRRRSDPVGRRALCPARWSAQPWRSTRSGWLCRRRRGLRTVDSGLERPGQPGAAAANPLLLGHACLQTSRSGAVCAERPLSVIDLVKLTRRPPPRPLPLVFALQQPPIKAAPPSPRLPTSIPQSPSTARNGECRRRRRRTTPAWACRRNQTQRRLRAPATACSGAPRRTARAPSSENSRKSSRAGPRCTSSCVPC